MLEVSHDLEWRPLNHAFRYWFIVISNSYPELEVSHDLVWRPLNHAFRYWFIVTSNSYPELEVSHDLEPFLWVAGS